jgi:cytochrome bd-type quinol oxidase subunit 2
MSIAPWWGGTIIAVKSWPTSSVGFTASIFVPLIPAYNIFAYWVFREKVEPAAHYH